MRTREVIHIGQRLHELEIEEKAVLVVREGATEGQGRRRRVGLHCTRGLFRFHTLVVCHVKGKRTGEEWKRACETGERDGRSVYAPWRSVVLDLALYRDSSSIGERSNKRTSGRGESGSRTLSP